MSFDYTPLTVALDTNSATITLRGLNIDDFGYLISKHGALMDTWFAGDLDPAAIVSKAPALVADVIACAAGEPQSASKAANMPLGLQIRAVSEIFKLTFSEADMGESVGVFLAGFMNAKNPSRPAPGI